ncbi:DUF4386 domain-containing protein [Sphingobacterium gobiense]|uniref:DUF4386 domain-containing protein n=1 Tax=Sphingobacterium gobiense TaxID=1382456 RepID=A0A2S9JUY6_9SPHI|nr:DUF4386 domain-containing protein [Sphingobacterium gobiense]PRD57092.1 DUF4386 domain-containing protein [Sphingobacterium gobiense]
MELNYLYMKSYRISAMIVGVLYIIGTISGILSIVVTGDLLKGNDVLTKIAMNPIPLNWGSFFILIMGLSLAAMPVFLYPIFKKKNEALALGLVVFRGPIEGSAYMLFVVNWLLLGAYSQEVFAIGGETASLRTMGNVFLQANQLMKPVLSIVFIIGAMFLYTLFYQTQLIPCWLSIWGIIGALFYLIAAIVKFFNIGFGFSIDFLYAPLAIQEMVMAFWLIVKGFNQKYLTNMVVEKSHT